MEQKATVAKVLLQFFRENNIDTIFGVLGDAVFPLFDALGKETGIKFYGASHEGGAAFMASCYAKVTGKIGVCLATSGPGAANLVNGLADAYFDKAPVFSITGQVDTKKIGTNAKQYINQQSLMASVTKSSEIVTSIESIIPATAKALSTALNLATVTHLSIPVDLFTQDISMNMLPEVILQSITSLGSGRADELKSAIELLEAAQRPLIILGKGNLSPREEIINLAEKIGAGIIIAAQAKGVISDNHPLVIGGIGEAYFPAIIGEVDCILLLGTASFEAKFLPGSAKLIQVVENQDDLDYSLLATGVIGEIEQVVQGIAKELTKKINQSWRDKIASEKKQLEDLIWKQGENNKSPIHPAHLMTVLRKNLPEDSIIVSDIGSFMHWFDTYFQAENHQILISSHWRSMGCGLPGAIGANVGLKDKKTVALVGDGGLLLSLGEIATAIKYQLPITLVVANNHQYNLEKGKMESQGLVPFGYQVTTPNFAAIAEAFGGKGRVITEAAHLEGALQESLNSDDFYLLDVHLDPVNLPFLN